MAGSPSPKVFGMLPSDPYCARRPHRRLYRQPGNLISKLVHIAEYISPLIPSFLRPDFHAEARGMTFRDCSFADFRKRLREGDWAESKDVTPWDCTFEAASEFETEFWATTEMSQRKTWFRSYAATFVGCFRVVIDSLANDFSSS